MLTEKLFTFLILLTSLHLSPLVKSNPSMFNSLKFFQELETLLG